MSREERATSAHNLATVLMRNASRNGSFYTDDKTAKMIVGAVALSILGAEDRGMLRAADIVEAEPAHVSLKETACFIRNTVSLEQCSGYGDITNIAEKEV